MISILYKDTIVMIMKNNKFVPGKKLDLTTFFGCTASFEF